MGQGNLLRVMLKKKALIILTNSNITLYFKTKSSFRKNTPYIVTWDGWSIYKYIFFELQSINILDGGFFKVKAYLSRENEI